jgi:uncharacterized protein YjbJ (UPF0337 family)
MSLENRMKATAKNIEGKAQEALGDLTGDPKQKAVGKAKQVQANIEHGAENLKEELDVKRHRIEQLEVYIAKKRARGVKKTFLALLFDRNN